MLVEKSRISLECCSRIVNNQLDEVHLHRVENDREPTAETWGRSSSGIDDHVLVAAQMPYPSLSEGRVRAEQPRE